MVAGSDTETGPEVVDDRPDSSLPFQRCPEGGNATSERDANDKDDLDFVSAYVRSVSEAM